MIVNICGAMGQGKSEVISYLKEEGYQVETLFSEVNRPKDLKEFCNSQSDLLIYRDRLVYEHLDTDSNDVLVIESSFIEMFVYSLLVIGVNFDYKKWLDSYYEMCRKSQKGVDLIINLPLTSQENSSLPFFTAKSFNILSKHYQGEIDHYPETYDMPENLSSEEICEHVKDIIDNRFNRIRGRK